MAPTRKSRSINKRFSFPNEASPNKDGDPAKRSMQRKRKLSNLLGLQWSRKELQDFYKAYRLYGKDWKKVAASVRNRSVEMVEALYTMNRAYLSLPEGTASVAGLIAMMTDYYSNLDGSDSEQESNDGTGTSQKLQKRPRGTYQSNTSKESDGQLLTHSPTVASSSGCLSLLKKRCSGGNRPRVVGKRTPRIPVSYTFEKFNGEMFSSPTGQGSKLKVDANDDDVAHEVALALAEASQRGVSPQVTRTPNRRTKSVMSSPIRHHDRMHAEIELTSATPDGSEMDEYGSEGSLRSIEADNGDFSKDKSYLRKPEYVDVQEARKGKRCYKRKLKVDENGNNHSDDIKEAYSGTEEGQTLSSVRGRLEIDATDRNIARSSSQVQRKKSKKALFRKDETSDFDAMQALIDLSLMMPETTNENESSVQVKEENEDLNIQPGLPDAMSRNHQKGRHVYLGVKAKGNQITSGSEMPDLETSRVEEVPDLEVSAIPETKQEKHQSITKMQRKKQKTLSSKVSKSVAHIDTHFSVSPEAESRDIGKKSINKGKRTSFSGPRQKQGKSATKPENSSSSTEPRKDGDDPAVLTVQVPVTNQANLPTKVRSRRKMYLQKPEKLKDLKLHDKLLNDQANIQSSSTLNLKEKLTNGLSSKPLRRWCACEWFYSAVDYPWFAKREFVEYLNHVGLGHIPRLARVEWGVIRSSLGKPRRLSEQFLKEEKAKLNQYRDSVRTHYTELRAGVREGLPTDLARPLAVGQQVMAIHPKTREIHDGSVLTVDHTRCRVQFDRPELGVEFVMDIDCMPSNPIENMPASLVNDKKLEGYIKFSPHENFNNVDRPCQLSPSTYPPNNLLKQGAPTNVTSQVKLGCQETADNQQPQHSVLANIQAKEADVQALAQLTRALDKKDALIFALKRMNDDILENQRDSDDALKDSEIFKKQYAAVLVQLNETNVQVSSALRCLRDRNTYQGNLTPTLPKLTANSCDSGSIMNSFRYSSSHNQDLGSHVDEIVKSSRTKSRTMVDAAMKAMSSLKGEGNISERMEEALDYVSDQLPLDDSGLLVTPTLASPDPLASHTSDTTKLNNTLDGIEETIPSQLISNCLATLVMIQKCTERQFPPAEVAQILDTAVTSLQPYSTKNLPIYAEIQQYMRIVKNQILALIPTTTTTT